MAAGLKGENVKGGSHWRLAERIRVNRERTAGPAGCCISYALASVTSLPLHRPTPSLFPLDGLNTFHVGIFNFMAANYSAALRSPSVRANERREFAAHEFAAALYEVRESLSLETR